MKWFGNLFRKVEFRMKWRPEFSSLRYVTLIFSWFMECKPEISGTLFRNSGKTQVSILQTVSFPKHNKFQFPYRKPEKFPGSIM